MSRPPADSHSAHSPFVLDATVLAHGQLTWEHEFRDTTFARLDGVALSNRPMVAVSLKFALHEQKPVVNGSLTTELELTCQRCLKPMRHPVHEQFQLMLVDSEAEALQVPEPYEAWVTNASQADVVELIEEQLLLALPLIARHPDAAGCQQDVLIQPPGKAEKSSRQPPAVTNEEVVVHTPFGHLRDLMRKQ